MSRAGDAARHSRNFVEKTKRRNTPRRNAAPLRCEYSRVTLGAMNHHGAPRFDVLLPAGGRISGDYARAAGTEIKALISFGGVTVLERTIAALRATNRANRIAVIGPREIENHAATRAADLFAEEGTSGPDNVFRGLEKLGYDSNNHARVLAVTTDLPFLSAAALLDFFTAADQFQDADICIPIVEQRAF